MECTLATGLYMYMYYTVYISKSHAVMFSCDFNYLSCLLLTASLSVNMNEILLLCAANNSQGQSMLLYTCTTTVVLIPLHPN